MATQFRLGDGVPRDAAWEACAEIGLRLSNVVERSASHPAQAIFVSADRQTLLHLIDDEAAGRAVILRGARAEEIATGFVRALGASGVSGESGESREREEGA